MLRISIRKSLVFAVPAVAALALTAVYARAGQRYTPLQVGIGMTAAYGALGSAHNSSDSVQYIGCSVDTYATGASPMMYCSAQNASRSVYCSSSNPQLITAANSLSGDSYLAFFFDASGTCTELYITTASSYAPKTL
jgi:hypothetical protein